MIRDIIAVTKSENEGVSLSVVWDVFRKSNEIEPIKDIVRQANDRVYLSWSTVDAVDSVGEKIPIEDAITQAKNHLERGGAISNEHTNDIIGKTIDYKVMVHPKTKTMGILTLNKIFNHHEMDEEVWKDIQERKKIGSSVGGFKALPSTYESDDNGNMIKVLAGFRQNETAITDSPANPYATIESFSAVAKSLSEEFDGKFVVKGDNVYRIEKQGSLLKTSDKKEDESEEFDASVKKENNDIEVNKGNVTMVEENNALEVAMKKLVKSEPLSAEEKALVKSAMGEEENQEDADVKEETKTKKSESGESVSQEGGDIPESPDPEEVNQVDVAKSVDESVKKALKEQESMFMKKFEELKKSYTSSVATPRPVQKSEGFDEVQKSSFVSTNPLDIALGKVKKSWTEVQFEDKRLAEKMTGDRI